MVDGRNGRRDGAPRQTRRRMVDGRSVRMVGLAPTSIDGADADQRHALLPVLAP
jgi:hypothetical protein